MDTCYLILVTILSKDEYKLSCWEILMAAGGRKGKEKGGREKGKGEIKQWKQGKTPRRERIQGRLRCQQQTLIVIQKLYWMSAVFQALRSVSFCE